MKRLFAAACALSAILALAAPVSAETVKIYAQGVVSVGQDLTGLFGTVGENFSNDPFTFTATFNLAHAGYDNFGNRSDIYGGAAYSYLPVDPPSLGGGTLTIDGKTQTLQGSWNTLLLSTVGPYSEDVQNVQDYVNDGVTYLNNAVTLAEWPGFGLFAPPPGYAPPSGNLCLVDTCGSGFAFNESVNGTTVYAAYGNLAPSIVTITVIGVPEPMTWAMLIVGVAMIGFAARRRHRSVALAS